MPRRNRPKKKRTYLENGYLPSNRKPKGSKRPRSFHHGQQRDEHFAEADRRIREAEGRAA